MSETRTEEKVKRPPPLMDEIELTPIDLKGAFVPYNDEPTQAPRTKPFWRRWYDFPVVVVLPIVVASLYLFLIASDRYVSETKFVVRSSEGSALAGVASLVETQGLSRANDETYVVNEYLRSRDMVRLLADHNALRDIISRPEADLFTRFPNFYSRDDFEHLYKHFRNVVTVNLDEAAGISTLQTIAYRPEDAKALAVAVMAYAEALINTLNDRAHDDDMRYAQMIVDKARDKTAEVEVRLTQFRNANGTVDPAQESLAAFDMIGRMSEDLAKLEASLGRQTALTPSSPGIESQQQRIRSYEDEIAKLRSRVVGTSTSTAAALSGYESLVLERELAAKSLEAAVLNFERARQEAQQKHLYIETVAQPSLSDVAEYPRRFLDLSIVAAVAIGVWLILRSLRISASEHGV